MKKVILLSVGVMFLAVLSTSCMKECTCTTTTDMEGIGDIVQTYETKDKCSEMNTSVSDGTYTTEMNCE